MDNKRPIELDALTERLLYAAIQDFDLSYDDEQVRSILNDAMRRWAEEQFAADGKVKKAVFGL